MKKKIDKEFYIAEYFKKTKNITQQKFPNGNIILQFFQRIDDSILCGMKEVINFLKDNTDTSKYKIKALKDGDSIKALEPVLMLEGPYHHFGHYEGVIDGILARQTSIATNAYKILKECKDTPLIAMADRADHYSMLESDGYALSIGGIKHFVTDASAFSSNSKAIGTMPHVLIGMFDGNTLEATKYFHKLYPKDDIVALVDFNNDVIKDSLEVADYFKEKLKMVRVDTSINMSDKFFKNDEEFGVTPNLIKGLRNALDAKGYKWVKIIVSSGFNVEKIKYFELNKTPVDYYGVGKSLLNIGNEFTCDAVLFNNIPIAKKGRKYISNSRLNEVN